MDNLGAIAAERGARAAVVAGAPGSTRRGILFYNQSLGGLRRFPKATASHLPDASAPALASARALGYNPRTRASAVLRSIMLRPH